MRNDTFRLDKEGMLLVINRLLGIMYILLNRESVTAAFLAERFEVSVRTIYRDIDALSQAGIPVYAQKGKGGGIRLMKNFVLDKMLLTKEEQQQILSALLSVEETTEAKEQQILQKLGDFFKTKHINWVSIDFSDWNNGQKQLYEDIKEAILNHKVITFDYYGQNREMSRRIVEPLQLLFKEYAWYLIAYCRKRQAIRFFKLKRVKRLEVTEEDFLPREEFYEEQEQKEQISSQQQTEVSSQVVRLTLWIDKKEAYQVYDRFEESEIETLKDGNFIVRTAYPIDKWVYSVILAFGASAEVLEPLEIREEIKKQISAMKKIYETSSNLTDCCHI